MGELALPQVFTAAMARAAGFSSHRIEQNVRSGRWHPLRRGVFCSAQWWALDAADPVLRHVLAATGAQLALGRYTVVSGWPVGECADGEERRSPVSRTWAEARAWRGSRT